MLATRPPRPPRQATAPDGRSAAARPAAAALHALSGHAPLLDRLRAGAWGARVHSVFDRAINIKDRDGRLFTLVARGLGDAPNTLVVDVDAFGRFNIGVGDAVAAHGGGLRLGRMAITLRLAAPWHAVLHAFPADVTRLQANLRTVRAALARHVQATRAARGTDPFAVAVDEALAGRVASVRAALARKDAPDFVREGVQLLGLGVGLTPSGDDVLVGLFAALHVPGSPLAPLRAACAAIAAEAPVRTNAISAAAVVAAAGGEVRASILALVRDTMAGSPEAALAALARVLAIGSTSGSDLAEGVASGLDITLQAGGAFPCP
ncbi:MAG TPA: DUF2877 domain-containing protein [Casimicrobiaceae bacterium]|nr:DUF2877 domain-containing protein [Casimicrobiaceae bacterium]